MRAFIARPNLIAIITASLFRTGNTPGYPRSIREACVFCSAPYSVEELENILLLHANCACISRPITASHPIAFIPV